MPVYMAPMIEYKKSNSSVHVLYTIPLMKKSSVNSLTTKMQTTQFRLQSFKNVKSKLYQIENSKTGGQTV